jgi:hypothetical protein
MFAAVWKFVMASLLGGGATAFIIGRIGILPISSNVFWVSVRIVTVSLLYGALYLCAVTALHRSRAPIYQLVTLFREMIPWGKSSKLPPDLPAAV